VTFTVDDLVILLTRALAHRKLYAPGHPRMQATSRQLEQRLGEQLAASAQGSVFIGVSDGKLVHEGRYLIGPSIAGGQLVRLAATLHCGGFRFDRGVAATEIASFLGLVTRKTDLPANLTEARDLLAAEGIRHIHVAAEYHELGGIVVEEDCVTWAGKDPTRGELPSPILVYQALFDVVTDAHGNATTGRSLDLDGARSVSEHLLASTRSCFNDIMQVMHYPDFDSYTVGHSVRVATLAVFMGDRLGLAEDRLLELGTAALLHDVGKSQIPDAILYKPGRLDEEEFRIMRLHAELGTEILLGHKKATMTDVAAAWGHHVRHDGGGYPGCPPWARRSQVTALLQICDVFEALTAVRPYKPPLAPRQAFRIMLEDRGAFDPALLRTFIGALGLYPAGNRVRLSDGSLALVTAAGEQIDRPRVRVTHDAAGQYVPDADQREVDLGAGDATLAVDDLLLDLETVNG